MQGHHRRSLLIAICFALAGCLIVDDAEPNQEEEREDELIAPNCESSSCFEVEIDVTMACQSFGYSQNYSFDSETSIHGVVENGGCTTYADGNGRFDLHCHTFTSHDYSKIYFRLKDYKGPGTYPLIHEDDLGGSNQGLGLRGNVSSSSHPDKFFEADASECGSPCVAVVSERSEPVNQEGKTFRFEVDITCPEGTVDAIPTNCDSGYTCNPMPGAKIHIEAVARR